MSEYIVDVGNADAEHIALLGEQATHCFGYPINECIVRCRDCKWCMAYSNATYCDRFAHGLPTVEPDGFCAWGERRQDNEG